MHNTQEKKRAYWRKHYHANKEKYSAKARKNRLRREFKMTLAKYDFLLALQDGVCDICKQPPRKIRLAVDHNHKTGTVRALLCAKCNQNLGWIEKVGLESVLEYLGREKRR